MSPVKTTGLPEEDRSSKPEAAILSQNKMPWGGIGASFSALLLGSEHHDHLAAFELGRVLDLSDFGELLTDAVHELHAELLVSHFAPAEAQRDLSLVAVIEEPLEAAKLRLEVVLVRRRAERRFFDVEFTWTIFTWTIFCLAFASCAFFCS